MADDEGELANNLFELETTEV
jgi:hypothetical protein